MQVQCGQNIQCTVQNVLQKIMPVHKAAAHAALSLYYNNQQFNWNMPEHDKKFLST